MPAISVILGSISTEKAARGVQFGIASGASTYVYPYRLRAVAALLPMFQKPISWMVAATGWKYTPGQAV